MTVYTQLVPLSIMQSIVHLTNLYILMHSQIVFDLDEMYTDYSQSKPELVLIDNSPLPQCGFDHALSIFYLV